MIAYLGPAGTFSEEAALLVSDDGQLLPLTSVPAIVTAVETRAADYGVLPIENSLEGAVNATLDLLIHETDLRLCREVVLPIRHMLAARPGVALEQVQVLHAHPQALGQSRRFVERCLPGAATIAALSNAAALVEALRDERPAAAITTARAAERHAATLLASDIQDRHTNVTRFVVLAREDHPPTGDDKTSFCFAVRENRAGALVEVLRILEEARINMAKLESRPARELLGQYIFLVDIEGHREERHIAATLKRIAQITALCKVFGSYPRGPGPGRHRMAAGDTE